VSAPDHPPPWRWEGIEDFVVRTGPFAGTTAHTATALVDVQGREIAALKVPDSLEFSSYYGREVLGAAGEMEVLLRRFVEGPDRETIARARSVLSCIDAARAADEARKAGG